MSGSLAGSGPSSAIEMRGVTIAALRDPSRRVAEQVDWSVMPGDYWVVAGLHRSGKSDFLMTVAGLMPPAEGAYRLFGEAMPIFDADRLAARLRLGLVFDGGQVFSHLTVEQNVTLPLCYHRDLASEDARAEVAPLLAALGLTPWADVMPGALGRSWQKRVGLARALALKPDLLLVDDPLAGLDLQHARWWLEFLDQLSKGGIVGRTTGVTLVVTTADFRPWRGHAKQFALLQQNRFIPLGSWEQLEAAGNKQVREMLAERDQTE